MTIYFDYRTIDSLLEDNREFYRQQKEFTLDELSQYDDMNGRPAYVSIEGIVYDVSDEQAFRQAKQNTPKIGSDQWINYIEPLVKYFISNSNYQVTEASCKYQKYILSDVFAGLEKIIQEAINQIQEWQIICESKGIKCGGAATEGTEITGIYGDTITETGTTEGIGVTINNDGYTAITGGASGEAGEGFGSASESKGFGDTSAETGTKLGPGATGGATGGALGSSGGRGTTEETIGDLKGTTGRTETTNNIRRDRLDI